MPTGPLTYWSKDFFSFDIFLPAGRPDLPYFLRVSVSAFLMFEHGLRIFANRCYHGNALFAKKRHYFCGSTHAQKRMKFFKHIRPSNLLGDFA